MQFKLVKERLAVRTDFLEANGHCTVATVPHLCLAMKSVIFRSPLSSRAIRAGNEAS